MKVAVLSSGSCGNCFYIENKDSAILVDAGINAKQIVKRLSLINRVPSNIKGIFITHEHSDHVRGTDVFSRAFKIPVFATKKTAESCLLCSDDNLINTIKNNEIIKLSGMNIEAFSKSHQAADPISYSVWNGKKISIITDVGFPCKNVIENVSKSDFLCLESNHDLAMLKEGPYPHYLKKLITSNQGHLSNMQASLCVLEHATPRLSNIILSHISQTNNTPLLALETFNSLIKERVDLSPNVFAPERGEMTGLFSV